MNLEDRLLSMLNEIDKGTIKLTCLTPDDAEYLGHPKFITDNNYLIGVFNDCGSFDYIDFIISISNDILFDYDRDHEGMPKIRDYCPSKSSEKINWQMNNKCQTIGI